MGDKFIILCILLIVTIFLTSCINISQSQNEGTNKMQKPQKKPLQNPPSQQRPAKPYNPSGDPEILENTDAGTLVKVPVAPGKNVNIFGGKDGMNVDLYDFTKKRPNMEGATLSDNTEECEEDCDEFCDEEIIGCVILCDSMFGNVCANAAAALVACKSGCWAIPPPFNMGCLEQCKTAFEQACSEANYQQCKDDCQGLHYELCTDTCYDEC